MPYSLLRQDARRDQWHAAFVSDMPDGDLTAGLLVDAPDEPALVTVAPDADAPSDYLELPGALVSDAMRRALDAAGVDNVQYFRARVVRQYATDVVLAEYWVANVVGAVACAAPLWEAGATPVVKSVDGPEPPFRIDPVRAHGFDVFRLAENRRLLVVSERVAATLRAAALHGVVLQPPEEYNGFAVSTAIPTTRRDVRSPPPRG